MGRGRVGVAYFTLSNRGSSIDRLVAAATPVAMRASLHTHLMEKGVMKMRRLQAVEISPGEPTVLKSGGLYVMLMGLKHPLTEGESLPLTLTFEKAGTVEVQVTVEKPGAMQSSEMPGYHRHGQLS